MTKSAARSNTTASRPDAASSRLPNPNTTPKAMIDTISREDSKAAVKLGGRSGSPTSSKEEILNAAALCFEENGFAATSIDDVASALNATKGMIYHHFRSKTDLFFAVYRRGMEINFDAINRAVDAAAVQSSPAFADATETQQALVRLTRMALAHCIALMAYQPFQRVLAQGVAMHQSGSTTAAQRGTLVELIEIRDSYEAQFRSAIIALSDAQGFELPSASVASKSFLAVLNSTVFWYKPSQKNAEEEQLNLARELVAFALRGLGATLGPEVEAELRGPLVPNEIVPNEPEKTK